LIEKGLPVALATDYNPGSSPSGNMNFVASLGCIQLKMTPEEVINATTINTAYALGLEKELGSIAVGKKSKSLYYKTYVIIFLFTIQFWSKYDWQSNVKRKASIKEKPYFKVELPFNYLNKDYLVLLI
jgi:hypothetical protein